MSTLPTSLVFLIGKEGQRNFRLLPQFDCSGCPFATPSPGKEAPNPDDPAEGDYDCSMLGKQAIWGELPECTAEDWFRRIYQDINDPCCSTENNS